MRDPLSLLLRALPAHVGATTLVAARSRPWASATFIGARHTIELLLEGEDAATRAPAIAAGIGEAEFDLRGHIVADAQVVAWEGAAIAIEALTIEDG